MMHLLLTNIEWDTEGESREECALQESVFVLDVDEHADVDEAISSQLSDAFGFCHYGYQSERFDHKTHAGGGYYPRDLAVIVFYPRDLAVIVFEGD